MELKRRKKVNPLEFFQPLDLPEIDQKAFIESEHKNLAVFGGNRCLPLDAPILMSDGNWKPLAEVKRGDFVISGYSGKPSLVTETHRSGANPVYRITFNDGGYVESTLSHEFPSLFRSGREGKGTKIKKRSVSQFISREVSLSKKTRLISPEHIDFGKVALPVNPYLVGALLGDGSIEKGLSFHNVDKPVLDRVTKLLKLYGSKLKKIDEVTHIIIAVDNIKRKKSGRFGTSGFRLLLEDIGIYGTNCGNKFIPHSYKTASISDRLQLLAGLVDTDGSVNEFSSKSKQLANDFVFVVKSLGGKATLSETKKSSQNGTWGTYYRVYFRLNKLLPLSMPRKQVFTKRIPDYTRRIVKSVDYVGKFETGDITVSDESHTYISYDYVLTGNSGKTLCGAYKVLQTAIQNPMSKIRCSTWANMSITIQQAEIFRMMPKSSNIIDYAVFSEQRGFRNKLIMFKNGSVIRFKTYEQGRESYQGAGLNLEWNDEEAPEDIVAEQKARLIDMNGTLLRTMTPLNGITYTYEDVVVNERQDDEIMYWFFNNAYNPYVDQNALERIIGSYAQKEAEVRQTGHFLNLVSGVSYYAFSEENIIDSFEYQGYLPLEVSCDFNVGLMSWGIGQCLNGIDYTFDNVELVDYANTDLMCQMLKDKYKGHKAGWIFYGDIAGSQKSPQSSRTNWAIIKEHFPNAEIYYQNIRNIKDRVDATNARLQDSKGIIRYRITKNCGRLIKDYRQVTWEMLLNKAKAGLLTHASDGESYKMFWKYSLLGKPTTNIISRI